VCVRKCVCDFVSGSVVLKWAAGDAPCVCERVYVCVCERKRERERERERECVCV